MLLKLQGSDILLLLKNAKEIKNAPQIIDKEILEPYAATSSSGLVYKVKPTVTYRQLFSYLRSLRQKGYEVKGDDVFIEFFNQIKESIQYFPYIEAVEKRLNSRQPGWALYGFQKNAIARALARKGKFLLLHDTGLGKTIQALFIARILEARKILIVAPKSSLANWKREIGKIFFDTPHQIYYREVISDIEADMYLDFTPHGRVFVIINYDLLKKLYPIEPDTKNKPYFADFGKLLYNPDLIIIDEAHYIKNTQAKRTKLTIHIARKTPHKLLLTATPIMNKAVEIFPLLHVVDPWKFRKKKEFAEKFAHRKQQRIKGGRIIAKYEGVKNAKELRRLILLYGDIKTVEDVLKELPPKQRIPIYTPVPEEYLHLEKHFLAFLKAAYIEKKIPEYMGIIGGSQTLLRQKLAIYKIDYVKDHVKNLLEDGINRIVVFFDFKKPLYQFQEEFSEYTRAYVGGMSQKARDEVYRWFTQPSSEPRIIAATIGALKESANLQIANHTVFAGLDWNPANLHQAEGRTRRIGTEHSVVFYHYFIAEGSWIENKIYTAIAEKSEMIRQVIGKKDAIKFIVSELHDDYEMKQLIYDYRMMIAEEEPEVVIEKVKKEWGLKLKNAEEETV